MILLGWRCEKCKEGFYGDPLNGKCEPCECDPIGSKSKSCNNVTGQCECKDLFIGRTCNSCKVSCFDKITISYLYY